MAWTEVKLRKIQIKFICIAISTMKFLKKNTNFYCRKTKIDYSVVLHAHTNSQELNQKKI